MAWLACHKYSEQLAAKAEILARDGDQDAARRLYGEAAAAERRALDSLDGDRWRTYGITAVSAVSLYYKSAQWDDAWFLAHRCLGVRQLPDFASRQLEDLLVFIQLGRDDVGIGNGRILVSIKGGEILRGGAPMDLVLGESSEDALPALQDGGVCEGTASSQGGGTWRGNSRHLSSLAFPVRSWELPICRGPTGSQAA